MRVFDRRGCIACMGALTAGAAFGSLRAARALAQGASGPPPSAALVAQLVLANHILFDQGVVDGFGHVSVRHDGRPDRFLLARNVAPALVTAADILTFDLEGAPVPGTDVPVYLERFIHAEVYRARPDVQAVVHSHSPAIIPFGVSRETRLRPVYHMAGFLGGDGPAVFDIRTTSGDATDLLIRSSKLGADLARALGAAPLILMRGHGATIVGDSIKQAVFRAVYAEANARIESDSLRLGAVNFLTAQEAEATAKTLDGQSGRAWDLWARHAEAGR